MLAFGSVKPSAREDLRSEREDGEVGRDEAGEEDRRERRAAPHVLREQVTEACRVLRLLVEVLVLEVRRAEMLVDDLAGLLLAADANQPARRLGESLPEQQRARPGIAPVARIHRQSTPRSSRTKATMTASRKPPYQEACRLASRVPRPALGTNSASIVCPMAYSAPMASPSRNRRTRSSTLLSTTPCRAPMRTNASRSKMKILRRPNRSVRYPKMGPPKKIPAKEAAPISPSCTGERPNSVVMKGSTTLMTPRSYPSRPSPNAVAVVIRSRKPLSAVALVSALPDSRSPMSTPAKSRRDVVVVWSRQLVIVDAKHGEKPAIAQFWDGSSFRRRSGQRPW